MTPLYNGGIAPGAKLVNVRVLGADGTGLTSDVIAGIDWVIANRARYNIRVINLSLGHPVIEPCATDPLCQAVAAGRATPASSSSPRPATRARRADGAPVLGGITSPGNSPFAITVGALNTKGTVDRTDDTRGDLQLARSDALRHRRQAGRRGARQQDRLARGARARSWRRMYPFAAHRRQRHATPTCS